MRRGICSLCGTPGEILYERLRDRWFGVPGDWGYRRCPNCGLVWLDPAPVEGEVARLYRDYFTHGAEALETVPQSSRNVKERLDSLVASLFFHATGVARIADAELSRREMLYLDDVAPGRLLEVGCGDGRWLSLMREKGWEVEGQEIDPVAAQFVTASLGIKTHVGPLDTLRLPAETFDAILLSHVIEHVHDPVALLAICKKLLRDGGRLVVITPNVASFGHAVFGRSWRALDPPRHLYLFTLQTLRQVVATAGFSNLVSWTSPYMSYWIAVSSLRDRDVRLAEPRGLWRLICPMVFRAYELRMHLQWIADSTAGEECVLVATRSR